MDKLAAVTLFAWAGWAITTVILVALYGLTALLGREVFRRLTRIWHLTVIGYWLLRLEKGGLREFQKAEKEDADRQSARAKTAVFTPLGQSDAD